MMNPFRQRREHRLQKLFSNVDSVLSKTEVAVASVYRAATDKSLLHASGKVRVAIKRLQQCRSPPERREVDSTWDDALKKHSFKVLEVKKSTIKLEKDSSDPGGDVRSKARKRLERYDTPIAKDSEEHKRVSNIRLGTAVKLLQTEFDSIAKHTENGNPLVKAAAAMKNTAAKIARKMSGGGNGSNGGATSMDVNGGNPTGGGARRTMSTRSANGTHRQVQRRRLGTNGGNGNGNGGNGNTGNGNGGNGSTGNGNGGNRNDLDEEDEDDEEEQDKEPEDFEDIEKDWLNQAKTIDNAKTERKKQSTMKADLTRIELNSTSGMLAGVWYYDAAADYHAKASQLIGFVRSDIIMGGDSLTWMLPSNLTAKLTSVAFADILEPDQQSEMERTCRSEKERISFIATVLKEMDHETKKFKFFELLTKKENDVWGLGKRQVRDVTDGNRMKFTCSENVSMTKTVVDMNDLERGALIDLCGFGAFRTSSLIDAFLGTFVVRGFEKISRENESNRAKIIVEDDTFHYWMCEGAHGGISFLKHFKDEGWEVMKIHPDAFKNIEFLGQNDELVSAREMLTSGFRSTSKYMQSWQGLYYCHRKNTDGTVEVRWLLNIISLCRLGHLELWLLWDYRRLLAMINVVRFLRGKNMYAFNSNPLKDALDERMNGRIFRKFLKPSVWTKNDTIPDPGTLVVPEQ